MSKSWKRGFAAAKAASVHSNADKDSKKIGAAIFAKGNLIAIGFNTYGQTHPDAQRTQTFSRNIHAEHRAVLKRRYYVNNGMVLYTYRETMDGKPACSKPCINCGQIIKEAGISIVRYINTNGDMEEMAL